MRTRLKLVGLLAVLCCRGPSLPGQQPPDFSKPEGLARTLRGFIAENLPPVLHEDSRGWGQQKLVTRGLEWKNGGKLKAQKSHKNHGTWRRIRVVPVAPALSLDVQIRDVRQDGRDRRTFTTLVGLDLRVEAEQQKWRSGVRTFSGKLRARARVLLTLQCEVTSRLQKSKGLLPDLVVRMRVLKSDVRYDHFVTENIAGIGGEMAEWIGDAGHGLLKAIRPSLERNLLEKANAAIVRAADTKEVRLSLGKWFPK
jgi:hypothetical protein